MKKRIMAILALVLLFSLTACGSMNAATTSPPPQTLVSTPTSTATPMPEPSPRIAPNFENYDGENFVMNAPNRKLGYDEYQSGAT